jgi:hypothetical protein
MADKAIKLMPAAKEATKVLSFMESLPKDNNKKAGGLQTKVNHFADSTRSDIPPRKNPSGTCYYILQFFFPKRFEHFVSTMPKHYVKKIHRNAQQTCQIALVDNRLYKGIGSLIRNALTIWTKNKP